MDLLHELLLDDSLSRNNFCELSSQHEKVSICSAWLYGNKNGGTSWDKDVGSWDRHIFPTWLSCILRKIHRNRSWFQFWLRSIIHQKIQHFRVARATLYKYNCSSLESSSPQFTNLMSEHPAGNWGSIHLPWSSHRRQQSSRLPHLSKNPSLHRHWKNSHPLVSLCFWRWEREKHIDILHPKELIQTQDYTHK